MFRGFWTLRSHDAQSAFVHRYVKQSPVSLHRVPTTGTGDKARPKEYARKYTLPSTSGDVTVCKAVFLSVLRITDGRVDRVLKMQEEMVEL